MGVNLSNNAVYRMQSHTMNLRMLRLPVWH